METYYGYVRSPADAIKLFEACRLGILPRVQRRLSEKERQSIRSGSVFVWDEREAGMRRWTDGKSWSASRVSGSFLTYREMEGKRGGGFASARRGSGKTPDSGRNSDEDHDDGEPEGYRYKADGLMKQSFSITASTGQHLHLISYYSRPQPGQPDLAQPTNDPALRSVVPAKGMYPESSMGEANQTPALTRAPMQQYGMPPQHYGPPHHHHQQQQQPYGAPQYGQPPPHGYGWPPSPAATPPYSHYTTTPYPPQGHHHMVPPHAQQQQQQPPPSHYASPSHYEPRAPITLPPPQKSALHQPSSYRIPSPPRIHDMIPPREQHTPATDARLGAASVRNPHGPLPALNAVTADAPPSRGQTPTPPRASFSDAGSSVSSAQPRGSGLSSLLNTTSDSGTASPPAETGGASEDHRALRMLDRSAFKQVVL